MPRPDSRQYREFVSAFYVGLAGLQTGEDVRAKEKLTLASRLVPNEPSVWANLALFSARQQEFDAAYENAAKAQALAPENGRIEALLGSIESKRGKLLEAIGHFKKSIELDPGNLKAQYALAEETERQGLPESGIQAAQVFQRVLSAQPDNVAAMLDVARVAAKGGDSETVKRIVALLSQRSVDWPSEARQRLSVLQQMAAGPNVRTVAVQVAFLRNVLARVPSYRQNVNAVKTPAAFVGEPFLRLLKLPNAGSEPAASDIALTFAEQELPRAPQRGAIWTEALALDDSGTYSIVSVDAKGLRINDGAALPIPAGQMSRFGVLAVDLNYDFKRDLVVATAGGLAIYQHGSVGTFTDITRSARIPDEVLHASYSGAWAFDVDLDGDLDVVLGAASGEPVVLRNNADGTFAILHPFHGVRGLTAFAAGDIDADGDPDVALIDGGGKLRVFTNERLGEFHPRPMPDSLQGRFVALAAGDVNGDGLPDIVALRDDGSVARFSDKLGSAWDTQELVKPAGTRLTTAAGNLILADFDNNGALDILAGDGRVFLNDARGLTERSFAPGLEITTAADLNEDHRLDLIGLRLGSPVLLINRGAKNYGWQTLRVRAAKAIGDQRINSFGIGGEVEIRSGLLAQKQIISSPVLHFGLGEHTQTDVARIVWPNGSVQAEFELKGGQSLLAEQRLKGSCPFLFAWDGRRMRFVKDGEPWSPALGLHINAQVVAGIGQTTEWFKIPGEFLAPRDGYYDLRVTAELWETFYIDHYSLMAIDHREGTGVYTDERFAIPSPPLKIFHVSGLEAFSKATDDSGADVSAVVGAADEKYLDTFGRGRYQGVTRDHWVELELPESAPHEGPLYLIGYGWMHPTDATVNIAISQNSGTQPKGLSLEVPDGKGGWLVAKPSLGFLAGRLKTAIVDLSGLFRGNAPRRLRLRTNLEIYWDQLSWAKGLPGSGIRVQRIGLASADLRYRGFSTVSVADSSSPEIPDYQQLEGTAQKWRDLEGYFTRFGDVRELLEKVDDRMVIMNAGDELRLRFAAPPPPAPGWVRDYVMVGDGWIKDGDYNSVYSKTVLPLPYHGMKDYSRPPDSLEGDPAYRLHPSDWQEFHTRYVSPQFFVKALWN